MLEKHQIDEHVGRILRDGYTIVENAVEPALCDALDEMLEKIEETRYMAQNPFEGLKTKRLYNLLARARIFQVVPTNSNVLPIIEKVLDEGLLVSSLSSVTLFPGQPQQPIHADDLMIPLPKPHVPIICNTVWALCDFTEENGATRIVPGSHLSNRSPKLDETHEHTLPMVMKRGSVLILHGSLWHGGGANRTTDQKRRGLLMNYCAGYIRQQENQQLGIPREIVKTFSPRLQMMLGYGVYRGVVGHINGVNPVALVREHAPPPGEVARHAAARPNMPKPPSGDEPKPPSGSDG
jgi:ectoine hydroxylase-related dioxygenase (phytanoyl-CoA dioxygenase family)